MNLVRVATVAAAECERQEVGLDALVRLLDAYEWLTDEDTAGCSGGVILDLAKLVEPTLNANGFRITPVTFRDGGSSASAQRIPDLFDTLIEERAELTVDEFVREFLWIHPFNDGNGRVGWLLYNWLGGTMDEPVPLPDFFGR